MINNSKKIIKMWKGKNIRTAIELDNALENFQVLFAYNSNHIEMPEVTYHDTREIFENVSLLRTCGLEQPALYRVGRVLGLAAPPHTVEELEQEWKP